MNLPGEPGPNVKTRPARIRTTPSSIRAAGSSPCPTRGSTGSSCSASTPKRETDAERPAVRGHTRGHGPRHIAFHRNMPFAYVINELGSSVTTYRFNPAARQPAPIQVVPSTPANYTDDNHGAEIAVAPSGETVYASNSGHDSIGFSPSIDKAAPYAGRLGTDPRKSPRFFALDPQPRCSMQPMPTRASEQGTEHRHDRGVQGRPGEREATPTGESSRSTARARSSLPARSG